MQMYQSRLATPFDYMPLITPEEIRTHPHVLLSQRPSFPFQVILPDDDMPPEDRDGTVIIWIGDKRPDHFTVTMLTVGIIIEAARVDIRLTTASNKTAAEADRAGDTLTPYPVFRVPGAQEDNIHLRRVLYVGGASAYRAIKTADEGSHDLRAHNLHGVGQARPKKAARELLLWHAERLAKQTEAGGMWPPAIAIADYLANLNALFAAHDEEAAGDR